MKNPHTHIFCFDNSKCNYMCKCVCMYDCRSQQTSGSDIQCTEVTQSSWPTNNASRKHFTLKPLSAFIHTYIHTHTVLWEQFLYSIICRTNPPVCMCRRHSSSSTSDGGGGGAVRRRTHTYIIIHACTDTSQVHWRPNTAESMYVFMYVCMVTVFVVFDVLIIEFFFEPGTIDKCMWGGN